MNYLTHFLIPFSLRRFITGRIWNSDYFLFAFFREFIAFGLAQRNANIFAHYCATFNRAKRGLKAVDSRTTQWAQWNQKKKKKIPSDNLLLKRAMTWYGNGKTTCA